MDEGIRYDASLEALAGLKTVTEGGVITELQHWILSYKQKMGLIY